MKNSMICTKCNSKKVVKVKASGMNPHQRIPLNKWNFKTAQLDRYICAACGYTEEYVQLLPSFLYWADKQLQKRGEDPHDEYV